VKFVVDAQLPPVLAAWLRARGHEAVAVRDIGLREADDKSIWSYAQSGNAIIVTKDEDFVLVATAAPAVRVLWVRLGIRTTQKATHALMACLLGSSCRAIWNQLF
jgi:predicted nuclease of predicted toxin-antitoxin system